jgi:hypothetical protein
MRRPANMPIVVSPLNIANTWGWEILCPVDFGVVWNGGIEREDIRITSAGTVHELPISHFGSGILTFHPNALFQTPPGYNLFVTGPVNSPKDGIQALSGVVETDWAPYTFTMNWKLITPSKPIYFRKGEPFCFFFPVPRELNETIEPVYDLIENNVELHETYVKWRTNRDQFNRDLRRDPESKAVADKWQKHYYTGKMPDGTDAPVDHKTKYRLKEFK